MEEDYFLYFEEFDWALRGRKLSFQLAYAPESCIYHRSGASSSRVMPLFTARYFFSNRIRFTARFMPAHLPAVMRGLAVDMLRFLAKGQFPLAKVVASVLLDSRRVIKEINRSRNSPAS
jgi:GT2 family glycosyltransferase